MTHEVNVIVGAQEHTLRGERAKKFTDILARTYKERPELLHGTRLERRNAEEAAFRETMEG
jgi:hypothetical protein